MKLMNVKSICHTCDNRLNKIYKGLFGLNNEVICKLGFQINLLCIKCEGYKKRQKK